VGRCTGALAARLLDAPPGFDLGGRWAIMLG
jgi:hypothetical protein